MSVKLTLTLDTSEAEEKLERLATRIAEISAQAEIIRKLQPGTADEVDEVLEAIERMTKNTGTSSN